MPNARTGKIARAPYDVRTRVNEMLRDGAPAKQIIAFLEQHEIRVDDDVVSRWRQGGYQDWLKEEERKATIKARAEASLAMVRDLKQSGEVHITEANDLILASKLNEALQDFDPQLLKDLMEEKPKEFFNLAISINAQTSERTKREKLELDFQKYRDKVAEQKKKIEDAIAAGKKEKGGLTREALAEIERAAAML